MRRVALVIFAVVGVVFAASLGLLLAMKRAQGSAAHFSGSSSSRSADPLKPDENAQDLSIPPFTLTDQDGRPITNDIFAGKGLKELQEGNIVSQTLIPGFPHIEFFGIYPTVETLTLQGTLLALLLFALWRTLTPAAVDPRDEDAEYSGESIPPELAERLTELQATARRLQDRVDSLEKEIEHDSKSHGQGESPRP